MTNQVRVAERIRPPRTVAQRLRLEFIRLRGDRFSMRAQAGHRA